MTEHKKDCLGSAWMIVAALFFTLMNLWVKEAHQKFHFGTGEIVFWRMSFSALVLGALAWKQGQTFATPHIKAHLSRSISGTLGMFFIFYAVMHLPLATGVTLSYTSSIFLALLSFIVLKEKISAYTQAILVLGFIGVAILLNPTFKSGQEWAAFVGLLGGLCAGLAYLQVRELSLLGEPAWRVVFYLALVGMLLSAVWASITGWHLPSWQSLPYLLGIGATAMLAQLAMTHAYKVGHKFTVASLAYLTVVFSTLVGIIWLDDKIGWQEWLGMGIIISSGILSSLRR